MSATNSKSRLTGAAQDAGNDPILVRAAAIVATLPPLTTAQLDTITTLLSGVPA